MDEISGDILKRFAVAFLTGCVGYWLTQHGPPDDRAFGWLLLGVALASLFFSKDSSGDDENVDVPDPLDNDHAHRILQTLPWRCYHCDFVTNDPEDAEAHFGERDDAEEFTPICKWWAEMDEEERADTLQDTLKELNKEREYSANLRAENEKLEYQVNSQTSYISSYKAFAGCRSITDIFHLYDTMEGRALAAEEKLAQMFCKCEVPYVGAQIVGTPTRCERCGREVETVEAK